MDPVYYQVVLVIQVEAGGGEAITCHLYDQADRLMASRVFMAWDGDTVNDRMQLAAGWARRQLRGVVR